MKNIFCFVFIVCISSISSIVFAKSYAPQVVIKVYSNSNVEVVNANEKCNHDKECPIKPKHCGSSDKIDGCYSKDKLVDYFSKINFVTIDFKEGWFHDRGFKDYLFGWYEADDPCVIYAVSTCNRETVGFMWRFSNNKWSLERVF